MANAAGWRRFTQVTESVPTGHKLYRASAPNYITRDDDQNLTQAAVDFLISQGIDSIISFNGYEYTTIEKERLARASPPIRYLHLKLGDFKPPTLAQFKQANDFFLQNTATLVHCGYGWGRTGTGITGLQIYTENGRSLHPLARTWSTPLSSGGNNVEKREQVSVLSELRNLFLPRATGTLAGDPKQAFVIINFATGYRLALSADEQSLIALSPDMAETSSVITQPYQWVVSKDSQGNFTLSNRMASTGFALTNTQGAKIDDLVTYGTETQENALFTIQEAASRDKGCYVISPRTSSSLAVAIKTPKNNVPLPLSGLMPALLAPNDSSNKFGLWILLMADFRDALRGEAELGPESEVNLE